MLLTYRYKLKPTKAQYAALDRLLEAQRLLYNAALQERIEAWRKAGKSISKIDQNKSLTQIRSFDEGYASMPVALSRWSLARLDDAMAGFFSRVKRGQSPGFPRFKPLSRWSSFGFVEFKGIRLREGRLLFSPIVGGLKLNLHRPVQEGSSIKSCTFTRRGRHWWITMAVDVAVVAGHDAPAAAVGIDVGVAHLATTSAGEHFQNARPRSRRERELRVAARALARCKRGSKRRRKVRARLALLQLRVKAARNTHLHQVSAELTRRYAFIAVEDLKLRNMTRSAAGTVEAPGKNVRQKVGLNRSLLDAAPGRLIQLLTYKAERAGGLVVKVDPRGTSQECSSCGVTVEKKLSMRVHRCSCGTVLDRDHNAALNILNRALVAHGRAKPPGDANVGHQPVRRLGTAVAKAA
ncbi:RNA-guided endonuclease InsQ/TnpB family protein [Bosea sp. RAC05]|uniref:RNA-guided endonuclease InsQ/TnpB family protein n=1 Tax=Bosea sp. RAC05 TaxID=1842539 RepID=UPI00083CF915|nr:RNA-guided endonuclease TnpB family protein [Bosea sp. RAC05]AOG02898.1 transposase, IS605 OrfB family [Bosea sp. RAC05]